VYAALVPCIGIAIAAAIYVATAIACYDRLVLNAPSVDQTSGEIDGCVEQLAKIGIAQLPGNGPFATGFGPRGGSGPLIRPQARIA